MAHKTIEQLPPVNHWDVEPLYPIEEIVNKLATAVKYAREGQISGEQKIMLELIYSLAKAVL